MSARKVAVVTGGNKGIGFAVVRGICKDFKGEIDVFLTARDEGRGKEAVKNLTAELSTTKNKPKFHQLDITDKSSIDRLRDFLQKEYGGLDILVNNAAIAFKGSSDVPFPQQAKDTIETNYTATVNICNALFPLLREHARVVNVSSFVSTMTFSKCSDELKAKFSSPSLDEAQCTALMNEFVKLAQEGKHGDKGYPTSAYGMSKVGMSALTNAQGRMMSGDKRQDILVMAADPGYVKTDMTSQSGPKSIDEGADTLVYLALLPSGCGIPNGSFVSERTVRDWTKAKLNGTRYQ